MFNFRFSHKEETSIGLGQFQGIKANISTGQNDLILIRFHVVSCPFLPYRGGCRGQRRRRGRRRRRSVVRRLERCKCMGAARQEDGKERGGHGG